MITASLVFYRTDPRQVRRILQCVEDSAIDRVFVYDNSSQASTAALVAGYAKARYAMHENSGYGSTHNLGFREARALGADYHVVLNPDVVFGPEVIDRLASYMQSHPEVGQLMPRVVYPDGSMQYLCKLLPTPLDLLVRRFLPAYMRKRSDHRFQMQFTSYDQVMEVPFLSGCFMFLRMEAVVQTGGFDERFFMYGEDIDFSRRMHARFQTLYYPYVSIVHDHAAASYHSIRMLGVHMLNIARYFHKWGWWLDRERRQVNRRILEQWKVLP